MYLASALLYGTQMAPEALRDVRARLPKAIGKLEAHREEGSPWWNVPIQTADGTSMVSFRDFCDFSHSMIGAKRMRNIEQCLDVIRLEGVPGDLAETGVWRGGSAIFMRGYLAAYDMTDRTVWAADSFEGLPKPSHPADQGLTYSADVMPSLAVSLEEVKATFAKYGLLDDQVRFLKGWFRDTLPVAPINRLALLRLDGDLYESTRDALVALYHRVVPGGFLLVDDYGDFPVCRQAVDDFRRERGVDEPIQKVDWTGVYWRKSA